MQLIFGFGSRLYVWKASLTKAAVQAVGEQAADDEDYEHVPQDPHSTLSAHLEISPDAIYAGAQARRFGFGSEEAR